MAFIALDDLRTAPLIRTDDFSIRFGVELGGECRGVHQITEHHRQLPSFRVGRRWCSRVRYALKGVLSLKRRLLGWLVRWRSGCGGSLFFPPPQQKAPNTARRSLLGMDRF